MVTVVHGNAGDDLAKINSFLRGCSNALLKECLVFTLFLAHVANQSKVLRNVWTNEGPQQTSALSTVFVGLFLYRLGRNVANKWLLNVFGQRDDQNTSFPKLFFDHENGYEMSNKI